MPAAISASGTSATRPYTPKTNGKAERFIQTALREWAYAQAYPNSDRRAEELPIWLHRYNWHRPHGSLKSKPPISRLALNRGQPVEAPQLAQSIIAPEPSRAHPAPHPWRSNRHRARAAHPSLPAISSLGGFRTPATSAEFAAPFVIGRHPKTFT